MDDQHRRLFELVTQLYDAMRGEGDQQIGTYLDEGAADRQPREMSTEMPSA